MRSRPGFTMIEVLLMIANLSALGSINAVALNPAHQISLANNAQRRYDVQAVLNATNQYMIDNRGRLPANISTTAAPICRTGKGGHGASCVNLDILTDDLMYLSDMPIDPLETSPTTTGYWIARTSTQSPRITVSAPRVELGESVTMTR